MRYLVDSNILTRLTQKHSPHYPIVRKALVLLRQTDEEICCVPQNLVEFWAVSTRPEIYNGLGLTVDETQLEIKKFRRLFKFYEDETTIFSEWENLVLKYQVTGKNVHDARIVAAMLSHNMTHLLTFNIKDFKRYQEITVIDPQNI